MAITTDLIRNSSDHLDEVVKATLITWFRQSDLYRNNAIVFSDLMISRIDATEGTVKARMINAVVKEIDKLGVGEVEIRGDRDAVWWNQAKERQALINTAFLILFDDVVEATGGLAEGVFIDRGLYGHFAVGQRPQFTQIGGRYTTDCTCGKGYPYARCYVHHKQQSYPFY